ncbi:MAG: hypothetical protein JRE40_15570 [Deltaproteobacteria bacterium]|nr:hypothetical protein [Deltaproteobacteria bacterium]
MAKENGSEVCEVEQWQLVGLITPRSEVRGAKFGLTPNGRQDAIALANGTTPSELGCTLAEAAVMLAILALERGGDPYLLDLAQKYGEATTILEE